MDYRGVLLIGAVLGTGALTSIAACGGPDPGAITFSERPSSSGGGTIDQGTSGTTSSSGSTTKSDAGGGDGGGGGDFVFGTTTFTAGAAAKQANAQGGADHAGNVEGKDCLQAGCHIAGGKGPTWAFAGTVKTAKTGGQPVVGAEVRVGLNGVEFGKTYTDNNGNFWFEKVNGDVPAGARVGVRNATKSSSMAGTITGATGGACNSGGCHGTVPTQSAQGFVLLAP